MNLNEFDFFVPEELVAQEPLVERDASRMLVLDRASGRIEHSRFRQLADFLRPEDFLVFNQSRVIRARLLGVRETGGKVEIFVLKEIAPGEYEALVKATASQKHGLTFRVGEQLEGEILGPCEDSIAYRIRLRALGGVSVDAALESEGHIPLPPYIRRADRNEDSERYQTIYAKEKGSVAAPTAGLHFTDRAFSALKEKGIEHGFVTLHVGLGTFQPIKVDDIREHRMHSETYTLAPDLLERCARAKKAGGRVIAVGTTSVRALESAARGLHGSTDLFLKPGDPFLFVDGMLTNFHQPKSSLVVMLTAFAGKDLLRKAYSEAVAEKYRFFSYGDCMLVV